MSGRDQVFLPGKKKTKQTKCLLVAEALPCDGFSCKLSEEMGCLRIVIAYHQCNRYRVRVDCW